MWMRLGAILVFLAVAQPAWAGYDEGADAFNRGDFDTAYREMLPLAQQGDIAAQFALGLTLTFADEPLQDYTEAFRWLMKAANQGVEAAYVQIALAYELGRGVPIDYAAAFDWYKKAVVDDDGFAELRIGHLYYDGRGFDQSYGEAMLWYRKAASKRNLDAIFQIGVMYYEGKSVPADHAEAAKWYRMAAEQDHARAASHLGSLYALGHGVPLNQTIALRWISKAADLGDPDAQAALDEMGFKKSAAAGEPDLIQGIAAYLRNDRSAAAHHVVPLAQQGNPDAQYYLGLMYMNGVGVEQNFQEAFNWYLAAATQGHVAAMHQTGNAYVGGQGVEMDMDKFIYWVEKAQQARRESNRKYVDELRQRNDPHAEAFERGLEAQLSQKYDEALPIWRDLAAKDVAAVQRHLAKLHLHGYGVTENRSTAIEWYRRAANLGDAESQFELGLFIMSGEIFDATGGNVGLYDIAPRDHFLLKQYDFDESYWRDNAQETLHTHTYVIASMWLILAAGQGHQEAAAYLVNASRRLKESQIGEAQRLAAAWRPEAR